MKTHNLMKLAFVSLIAHSQLTAQTYDSSFQLYPVYSKILSQHLKAYAPLKNVLTKYVPFIKYVGLSKDHILKALFALTVVGGATIFGINQSSGSSGPQQKDWAPGSVPGETLEEVSLELSETQLKLEKLEQKILADRKKLDAELLADQKMLHDNQEKMTRAAGIEVARAALQRTLSTKVQMAERVQMLNARVAGLQQSLKLIKTDHKVGAARLQGILTSTLMQTNAAIQTAGQAVKLFKDETKGQINLFLEIVFNGSPEAFLDKQSPRDAAEIKAMLAAVLERMDAVTNVIFDDRVGTRIQKK